LQGNYSWSPTGKLSVSAKSKTDEDLENPFANID